MSGVDPTMDPVLAYLLADDAGPPPPGLVDFAAISPPPELVASTLAAIDAAWEAEADLHATPVSAAPSQVPANSRRWLTFVVTGLAVAASALLVVRSSPETGDVSSMTARGLDETTPAVSLKLAVDRDGTVIRHRKDRSYAPGDTFFFRAQSGSEGWVHLVVADPDGVEVLAQQAVAAGEVDIANQGQALTWTLDETDQSATYALVSSREPIPPAQLIAELESAGLRGERISGDDGGMDVCASAARLGRQCDAVVVEVRP